MGGFDIVPDGKPVEEPEAAAEAAYQKIPATAEEMLGEQAGSTISQLARVVGQGAYQGSDWVAQTLYGMGMGEAAMGPQPAGAPPVPAPGSVPSPMLSHEAYQERYAPIGNDGKPASLGDGPMPEAIAKLIGEAKRQEIERDNVTARYENAHSWPTNFAVGALGFMLDPLRAATAFIPGVGEEALAARLGAGLVGRTLARLGAGTASGALAMGPVAALQYGLGREEASDYGLREAMLDTAMGAGLGALFHAGITGPARDLRRYARPPEIPLPPELDWTMSPEEAARQLLAPPQPRTFEPTPLPLDETERAIEIARRRARGEPVFDESPGEAPGTFRTTVDINGERTTIEGPVAGIAVAPAQQARAYQSGGAFDGSREDALRAATDFGNLFPDASKHDRDLLTTNFMLGWDNTEQARAAAAPIVEADAQTQHAAISAAVSELIDGRPVETEAFFPPAEPTAAVPTPAEVASTQAGLHRDGFVAGVPPEVLKEATTAIYSPPEPEKVEAPTPAPELKAEQPGGQPPVAALAPAGEAATALARTPVAPLIDEEKLRRIAALEAENTAPETGGFVRRLEAEQAAEAEAARASKKPAFGDANKVFTKDAADRARERIRQKLSGSQLNAGFDPELALDGLTLAGYYIEGGVHKFADFSKEMVGDFGEAIRPYLRQFYEAVRHTPEFDAARHMSSAEEIDRAIEEAANDADELQGSLRRGDEGAGAQDVQSAAAQRPVGPAPEGEEPGGAGNAGGPLETVSEPGPGGGAAGGGNGPRDADRLPATGEAGSPGTTGGPGGRERNGEASGRLPDADVKGTNHVIEPGSLAEERGPRVKANGNLAAIELAKSLIAEGRPATKEEQTILARYVGWGGLSGAFPDAAGKFRAGLDQIGARLKALLTPEEYRAAAASVLNAHYTSEPVIRAMWDAVQRMGFKGGSVFEPGMGIGHFLGLMPGDIAAASQYHGIERDQLTAQIAKLLYPESGVRQADFTRVKTPLDTFDLAIGNPPFADITITADARYAARRFSLHNYFFAKSIDSVRPGGLLGFITSQWTMNSMDSAARRFLAERAEFVGGVRLPSTAFKQNAGTEVTTDILFFKKRLAPAEIGEELPAWAQTVNRTLPGPDEKPIEGNVNRYFAEHPKMVLGEEGFFGKLHKGEYGVRERPGTVLADQLRDALGRFPENIIDPPLTPEAKAALDFSATEKKEGSYYVAPNGRLMQYREGAGRPVPERGVGVQGGKTVAEIKAIRELLPIRDMLREVYRHNLAADTPAGDAARANLNRVYDEFVAKNGPINKTEFSYRRPSVVQQETARLAAREEARAAGEPWQEGDFDPEVMLAMGAKPSEIARARETARSLAKDAGREFDEGSFNPADMPDIETRRQPNLDPFREDQQSYWLSAVEKYDPETGLAEKRRIFRENNLTRYEEPQLASPHDGLLWSMNKLGRLDIGAIAEKLGTSQDEVIEALGDAVMRLPGTEGAYVARDAYLSGDVVSKLAEAKAAAETDPRLQRNVSALEAVQPAPLSPAEIVMNLGMPWIPRNAMLEFMDSIGMGRTDLQYNDLLGQWVVDTKNGRYGPRAAEWSTGNFEAHELLSFALNGKSPVVRVTDPGPPRTIWVDQDATAAAQEVVNRLKDEFTDWTMADPERALALAMLYNEKFNRVVLRQWNGDYLTTPGVSADWHWRPHQTRVVARIIQDGNTYMAHAVGAGKTSAMIGAGMEMRRLGLVSKPMYAVPNHMLGQFAKEFYEQYPTARIMVADSSNFHTSTRKQFVANIAQQDLDGVIITHSALGLIPISPEFNEKMIREATDEIDEAFAQLGQDPGELKKVSRGVDSDQVITVKRLQRQKQRLEQKLLSIGGRQDEVNTFEELGVDFLFVDEAHQFRKLSFVTQTPMKGIDSQGSDAAWDLYSKTRYLDEQQPGRSVVMASGTPVTNTMGELYSLSRFMQPQALAERGLSHFDGWKQAFGTVSTELEPSAGGGYKQETRFNKFVNIPELYKMVGSVMDVVTSKDLAQYVTRPEYLREPVHLAPRTPWLDQFRTDLNARAQAIASRKGPPKKGDDIILSLITDGRKGAIDPRLIDMDQPGDHPSKLNEMIDNVHRIWGETKDQPFYDPASGYTQELFRGPATQIVFANSGIASRDGQGRPVFSAYQWMRREWIRRGIPASEIAFIRDYENPVAKLRLLNDVNEGKVRILVGSVQKMGTGINVQRRLTAIHNLDPLWYPADDEQRNGRGFRQGNLNPQLHIHDYSTTGTYDEFMWGLMAKKGRFIEQFFRGDPNLREMEDLGEADTYEQLAAMTTEDPRVLQLAGLRQDLTKLERRQSGHRSQQFRYEYDAKGAEEEARAETENAAKMQDAIARSHDITGDNFKVSVGDQVLTDREGALKAVDAAVAAAYPALEVGKAQQIGEIGGFPLLIWAGNHSQLKEGSTTVRELVKDDAPYFYLRLYDGKDLNLGKVAAPNMIASAATYLRMLPSYLEASQERARAAEVRAASSRAEIGKPFADAEKIPPLREQVNALEAALGAPPTVAPEAPPEQLPAGAIQTANAAAPGQHGGAGPREAAGPEAGTGEAPAPPDTAFTGDPELVAAQQRLGAIEGQLDPEERAAIDAARARAGDAADEAGICIGESED